MSPHLRRFLAIAAAVVGTPLLALLLLLAFMQTPPGKVFVADIIANSVGSPDLQIRITGVNGSLPFAMRVERLEIADSQGVWLTAKDVVLDWLPLALIADHLKIDRLQAAAVDITRRPLEAKTRPERQDSAGSGLPRRFSVDAVAIDRLTLSPELAGETAQWRLSGSVRVAGLDEDNWLTVKAERSDGGDGLLDLQGRYQGAREILDIKLIAREGATTINRFSRLESKQGIAMQADIAGPLTDLNGTLTIDAGNLLRVDGKLRAGQRDNATEATLRLTGRAGRLGDAPWLQAIQGDWSLNATGSFDPAKIVLRQAELQGPPGKLAGSGRIDRRNDTGDLTFTLEAAAASFVAFLPDVSWRSLTAKGRLNGKLMYPAVAAIIAAEDLKVGDIRVARATANLDGAERPDGTRSAALQAELNEIVLPTADGRALTTSATIAASAALPRNRPVVLHDFKLASPVLTAEGAGQYDPQRDLASGSLRAAAADLSVFAQALDLDIAGSLVLSLQAEQNRDQVSVNVEGALENGRVPQVPPPLLAPKLTASLRGSLAADRSWRVQSLSLESGAGSVTAQGQGTGRLGEASLDWKLHDLAALDAQLAGRSSGTLKLSETAEALTAQLRGALSDARVGVAQVSRLAVDFDARRVNGQTSGRLAVDGEMQKAPIKGGGDFTVADDGRATIRDFDLRWASVSVVGENFAVADTGATGDLAIKAGKLQDLNPFLPVRLAGSLDATLKAIEDNKVKLAGTAQNFRLNDDVALDRAQVEGTVTDPLGRAAFELSASASGSRLAGPLRQLNLKASGERAGFAFNAEGTGDKLRAIGQGKAAINATEATIDLQSLNGVYSGQTIALAAPARIRLAGDTTTIERATLKAGTGTVSVNGTVGPNSNLDVQGRALPLQLLRAFDPELQIFGVANFTGTVRGSLAQPQVDLTLDASDMRLRTIRTAGIPPGALTAKLAMRNDTASLEGRFTAGRGNTLNFSGSGPLPDANGINEGRLRLEGGMRLAQLTPFLAGNGRLNGNLAVDLTLTASKGAIGGDGTVRIVDGRYFNYADGIAVRDINATFAVVGDRLEIRQFSARPKEGEITLSGSIQVDRQFTLPVDVNIVARSARVLDRADTQITVSANLHLGGSVMQGKTLDGTVTVEKAEINLDANVNTGPDIATVQVREINRPGGAPDDKPVKPLPPGPQTQLAIKVNAPQGVLVRGRGLDVELGGTLDVAGVLTRPQVKGALQLRRGTFAGAGRKLEFTRGTVTFPDPDRLEPYVDFTAAARIEGGTAEIVISGTPASPKVTLTSSPPLPQDEIMARLLFGQSTAKLSPVQMAEIAQSVGTLSGLTGSGGGVLDRLRKGLGFDRLGVSSDPDAKAAGSSPIGTSSLEAGRYVAPGVYLGARQGATTGSSSAVVEIEVTPHVKVESEVGTGARSKVGIAVEWDY
jgi:translocation and assembly module TamB